MKTLRRVVLTAALALLVLPTASAAAQVPPAAPVITSQPHSTEIAYYGPDNPGGASFHSVATADGPLVAQWQVSTDGGQTFADIPGETDAAIDQYESSYSTEVTPDNHEHIYRVQWSNTGGTVTSVEVFAALHFVVITSQPQDVAVKEGEAASFSVEADAGYGGFTVQWQVSTDDGASFTDIEGATAQQYVIGETEFSQDGNLYRAIVTDAGPSEVSEPAMLSVEKGPPRVPSEPTQLKAMQTGPTQVTVTWELPEDDGSDPITAFVVRLDGEDHAYDGDAREAVFNNLVPRTYDVAVTAENAAGTSPAAETSVEVTVEPVDEVDPDDEADPDEEVDNPDDEGDDEGDVEDDSGARQPSDGEVGDAAGARNDTALALSELPATGGPVVLFPVALAFVAGGMLLRRRT